MSLLNLMWKEALLAFSHPTLRGTGGVIFNTFLAKDKVVFWMIASVVGENGHEGINACIIL